MHLGFKKEREQWPVVTAENEMAVQGISFRLGRGNSHQTAFFSGEDSTETVQRTAGQNPGLGSLRDYLD